MVTADIIVPVIKPTLVIMELYTSCLDQKDPNAALVTMEGIASHLHGTKLFTVLDVKSEYWYVQLNEPSSYHNFSYTITNGKEGHFEINSVPEIFQQRMYELVEHKAVADDFVVVG